MLSEFMLGEDYLYFERTTRAVTIDQLARTRPKMFGAVIEVLDVRFWQISNF